MDEIDQLKKAKQATILAHYYVDGDLQDIADSLKIARQSTQIRSSTIVFCGVNFMAVTAKILNPNKRVLLPDLLAGCSLAESCPTDELALYQHRLRKTGREFLTVAYINTSAADTPVSQPPPPSTQQLEHTHAWETSVFEALLETLAPKTRPTAKRPSTENTATDFIL